MSLSNFELTLVPEVQAAMRGDEKALTSVLDRCRNLITSLALAIVRDIDASEEIAQQVFVQIWTQLPQLRQPTSFMPWVRQLTRRRAFNYLRSEKAKHRFITEEADHILAQYSNQDDMSINLEREQQALLVQSLLNSIPDDNREIVLLYYREEQSSQQVAALLGMSEVAVRKRLQRVREQLRENWLRVYGQAILQSAAPATLFSALVAKGVVAASMTTAAPVAIAAGTSGAASSSGSLLAKAAWLLSGVFLATIVAVIGVLLGMQGPIALARDGSEHRALTRIRNWTVVWVLISGVSLTLAYALTTGWIAPVSVFLLLVIGLIKQHLAVWRIIGPGLREEAQISEEGRKKYRSNLLGCWLGMLFGYGGGFAGILIGLWQSGRFVLG